MRAVSERSKHTHMHVHARTGFSSARTRARTHTRSHLCCLPLRLRSLADTLRLSGVTHLFYECTVAGQWKETYRDIIRNNRAKHALWRFGPDAEQNRVILAAVKNWYCPTSHKVNKQFCSRMAVGWSGVERVQCEACGKWRRLPNGLDGWPRVFYCALNTWDSRFASCEAPEEEWSRDMPMNG